MDKLSKEVAGAHRRGSIPTPARKAAKAEPLAEHLAPPTAREIAARKGKAA